MSDVFFWLRTAESLAGAAVAVARTEWTLHTVRAQAELLLRSTADSASLYPERAGELWTEFTLPCERATSRRYGLDEVVAEPKHDGALFDMAATVAKNLCALAHERFCALLDASVRGGSESGMSPSLLDLAAALTEYGAKGSEPDAKTGLELAMSAAEVMRGLIDASAPDEILRANSVCVLLDKARVGTINAVNAYEEANALFADLARDGASGKLVGFPPILADCFSRLLHRLLRRAKM